MRPNRPAAVRKFLGLDSPVLLAHRGFDLDGAENTMKAFRAASNLGVHVLETDVHPTSDGVVVAFHDDDLDRVTTGSGKIADHTWQELAGVRAAGEPLCRLADLLEALPEVRFNIDLKSDAVVEPFVQVLTDAAARHPGLQDRICVASFSDTRLHRVRRLLPAGMTYSAGLRRTALVWLGSRTRVLTPLARLAARGADVVQVPLKRYGLTVVDRRFIDTAHRVGLLVHVWTINDEDTMRELLRSGVDGIVTDRSDLGTALIAHDGSDTAHSSPPGSEQEPRGRSRT